MAKHQRRRAPRRPVSIRGPIPAAPTAPPPPDPTVSPAHRPSHFEAVAIYEQGIRRIQEHDFARAAELLQGVVARFPEERELSERARLYLALCDRQLHPTPDEPQSSEERVYAATLALNAGHLDRAIDYLDRVCRDDPANDRALYMLATAHAQRGNLEVAIPYLQQAIESNPDNRMLARVDPDLAGLRAEDTFAALLESPLLHPNGDRKRPVRHRSAR